MLQRGDKQDDPYDLDNILTAQLPDLPEKMVNFGIDYRYEDRLTARLALNYVASREHIQDREMVELDAYTHVDFSASHRFLTTSRSQWEALFSAENILDEDYEEKDGYPMPGATVIGGLRVRFWDSVLAPFPG
jgi:outer membrane cobalamin receptor